MLVTLNDHFLERFWNISSFWFWTLINFKTLISCTSLYHRLSVAYLQYKSIYSSPRLYDWMLFIDGCIEEPLNLRMLYEGWTMTGGDLKSTLIAADVYPTKPPILGMPTLGESRREWGVAGHQFRMMCYNENTCSIYIYIYICEN